MNIKEALDNALESGLNNVVCSPKLYRNVVCYIREREAERYGADSLRATMEIAIHPKQQEPQILIFDTKQALEKHIGALDA